MLPWASPQAIEGGTLRGQVIHVDHFGNAVTNISRDDLAACYGAPMPPLEVAVVECAEGFPFHRTYGDADRGAPMSLIGSAGFLELAVNAGSAASRFDLAPGAVVETRRARKDNR